VTDPFPFFNDYEVEIPDPEAELLRISTMADATVFVSITLLGNGRQLYANLLGPLVINFNTRLGAQVIQNAARYNTRHFIGERITAEAQNPVINGPLARDTVELSIEGVG